MLVAITFRKYVRVLCYMEVILFCLVASDLLENGREGEGRECPVVKVVTSIEVIEVTGQIETSTCR